jgi:hypothetical protein
MIILVFLCIITGIIIWNLYYTSNKTSNKKKEDFNSCSSSTPSMMRSGERIYFANTLLDGHYDKTSLYNNAAYHQQNTNKKLVEFKNKLIDSRQKHDGTRRTFDALAADIPKYYTRITNMQTDSDNTIKGYKVQANNTINSTDPELDAYIVQKHNVDVPDKIKNELVNETNKQLNRVRDTTSNYNNVIDFNTYLTEEMRDTNLNGTKIIDSAELMSKIQAFLPYKSFKLLYSADSQTYSPTNFHDACDNRNGSSKMSTLTIYKTKNGSILLGYNNDGWQSYGNLTASAYGTNWISLLKGQTLGESEPSLYFNKCNLDKSLYNNYYSGPQFGETELLIKSNKVSSSIIIYKVSKSKNSTYGYDSKLDVPQNYTGLVNLGQSTVDYDTFSLLPNGNDAFDSIEVFQVLDEMVRIYDWQKRNNKIVRVRGDTGNIQCYAKTKNDQTARRCDEQTPISDFNKLPANEIFAIDCNETDIQKSNHWCNQASKDFSKDPNNINYEVCPVGWNVLRDPNNPTKTMCYSPNGSANAISLKVDTVEMKRSRADARFPFKYDYTSSFLNDDLRTNIRKNVSNILGTSTTPVQVNLDRFDFNRNGVMINVFKINAMNKPPKGSKISTEMITTAINFNWAGGPIFRLTDKVYIEFITFVLIPDGAKTVKFGLRADNSARLSISKDGTKELSILLNWTAIGNGSMSAPVVVKEKMYLPIQVDYHCEKQTDSASVTLAWSINDGPMQIISRDSYFLSKEQCAKLDAMGNASIPISKDCTGVACDIEGQLCLSGTPGAGTNDWICKNNGWVIQSK